ncbi:MAG: RluA family pseudouridine synthase [Thermovirgaceae bacterium]|nr:RluA family pseudouridine synthase [Thermovirgaceae bacterium]
MVSDDLIGERLDVFLTWKLDKTRSQVQFLIRDGKVSIERQNKAKASLIVRPGMVITVKIQPKPGKDLVPEPVSFGIVYEDDDLVVVDKPSGLIVHPSPGHWTGTLVHGLLYRFPEIGEFGGPERPGIVHRLDGSTSGLMVVSRNARSHDLLSKAFQERRVQKEYLALVWGSPKIPVETVDLPIGRDPRNRYRMAVTPTGKKAVTGYRVLWSRRNYSLVRCSLLTGRTHQIRVHMKHIGCPIVGDQLYAPRRKVPFELERVFLHSWMLGFPHPKDGRPMRFRSPLPLELVNFLTKAFSRDRERP